MTLENRRVESEKDRIMRRDWIRKAKEQDRQIEEVQHGDVPFLEFPLLRETKMVVHGFTTREGGVSEGIFSSMNLSLMSSMSLYCLAWLRSFQLKSQACVNI